MTTLKEDTQIVGTDSTTAANLPIIAADDSIFRSFIENLPAMFYAVAPTPPHKPIFISRSFERFGYPLEVWLTKPDLWDIITHPDDREEVLGKTRAALKRGESTDFLYRIYCADGSIAWIRDRGCFIKNKDGVPVCWQGVIIDMTPQIQADLEIKRREQLYRAFAKNIPDTGVLLFDHDLRYILADGVQLAALNWTSETFEGKTVFEVFSGKEGELWAEHYRKALAGETQTRLDTNANGFFSTTILPIRDETGTIFAGMVIWQDIAGRIESEEKLRESEARYRELFENASDII